MDFRESNSLDTPCDDSHGDVHQQHPLIPNLLNKSRP